MDKRRAPEFTIELSADRANVKDIVTGILHTIFFHRLFTPLAPATHDVLDLTLPYITDTDVAAHIDAHAAALLCALDRSHHHPPATPPRVPLVLQFREKRRGPTTNTATATAAAAAKKSSGWFGGVAAAAPPEAAAVVWETWVLDVTLTGGRGGEPDRRQMERRLQRAAMQVVATASRERAHIPPITSNETNPFPYQIAVGTRGEGRGSAGGGGLKRGIF